MNTDSAANTIPSNVHERIRAQAARASSLRDAADMIFAVLAESGINTARVSLDDWKTMVAEAAGSLLCGSGTQRAA